MDACGAGRKRMNNDSDRLISLLFGSEVKTYTKKENIYLSKLFNNRNVKYFTENTLNYNADDLIIMRHERPDLLLICDNTVFALEHFKIDSSETNRKGSKYKQKYNKQYNAVKQLEIDEKLKTEKMVLNTEKVSTHLKYTSLFNNLINCINDHYAKLLEYEKNIRSIDVFKHYKIEFIFYVEYDLVFPSFFMNKINKMNSIFPHNDINFINFLKDKQLLSGIMFYFNSGSTSIPNVNQFIMIKDGNLLDYKINGVYVFDPKELEIHDFEQPMMTSVSFTIPKSI